MKKIIFFLLIPWIMLVSYGIPSLLGQSSVDETEIKKVIDNYLEGMMKGNLDLLMNQFSSNYLSFDGEGNIIGYIEYRSLVEENLKKITNVSIADLKITELNIRNDKAILKVEYNVKGFNRDTAMDIDQIVKKIFILVKEDGSWKITQIIK